MAPEHRAQALGWLSSATAVGFMLGPVLGSSATHWGPAAPGLVAAGLCLLNVFFAWKWLPESKPPRAAGEEIRTPRPIWHATWQVLRHPKAGARLNWSSGGRLGFTAITSVRRCTGCSSSHHREDSGYFFSTRHLSLVSARFCSAVVRGWVAGAMRLGKC